MNRTHLLPAALCAALCASMLGACSETTTQPTPEPSSYQLLQSKILTKSCATSGCHVSGSPMAAESGLVLESGVAYASLVGVAPKNTDARAHGLLRVKPGVADSSFLFIKVSDPTHHAGYGARMPLGMDPLSDGQIRFIRDWIAAGAPETGAVADARLLDDTLHGSHGAFTPLAPPAPGAGFQISTPLFDVAPRFERELFVYRRVGNTDTVYINRLETKMRPGSHHLVLYTLPSSTPGSVLPALDVIRDLRNPNGSTNNATMRTMAYHQFAGGAMSPYQDYRFPEGVALAVPPNAHIDMNSHYVNASDGVMQGEAFANLYTVDRSRVQHVARPLFLNNDQFSLPPGQRTTVRRTFTMPERRTIFVLSSHMHKHGERFVIRIAGGARNGEVVYESTDWAHPPVAVLNEHPIVLERGEGLTSEVTYNNTTGQAISFGLTSEDEMNIIYAYYY